MEIDGAAGGLNRPDWIEVARHRRDQRAVPPEFSRRVVTELALRNSNLLQ